MKINLGSMRRDNPRDRKEKVHKLVMEHKISAFGIGILLTAIITRFLPWSWLSFIPAGSRKFLILFIVAQLFLWIPMRKTYNWFRTLPVDVVVVGDLASNRITKAYYYKEGQFEEEFEFKNGSPLTWNYQGRTYYQVVALDTDEDVAYCSWLGDLNDWEIAKFKSNYEAQRLFNDELRGVGANLSLTIEQIVNKVQHEVTNRTAIQLREARHSETVNEGLGSFDILTDEEGDEMSHDEILEKFIGVENVKEKAQHLREGENGQEQH